MVAAASRAALLAFLAAFRADAFTPGHSWNARPAGVAVNRGSVGLRGTASADVDDSWNPFSSAEPTASASAAPASRRLVFDEPPHVAVTDEPSRRAGDTEQAVSLSTAPRFPRMVADELVASMLPFDSGGAAAAVNSRGATGVAVSRSSASVAPPHRDAATKNVGGNAGNGPRALELGKRAQLGHLSHRSPGHMVRGGPLGHHPSATRGEERIVPPPVRDGASAEDIARTRAQTSSAFHAAGRRLPDVGARCSAPLGTSSHTTTIHRAR
jgi:hypothetical protein